MLQPIPSSEPGESALTVPSAPSRALVATRLGYLAVLPFVLGAVLVWWVHAEWRPLASQTLTVYAAVVLSFIGAIHWGLAFPQSEPDTRLFVWGVVPSIVAWLAVLLQPGVGLAIHAAMLIGCYVVDRNVYRKEHVERWLPLRLRLTIVATVCCLVGALGS